MAITIPTKTEKKKSLLVDAIKILAWQEYKASYIGSLKGLELWAIFKEEWMEEEIHSMSYAQVLLFAKDLEYSENELLHVRSEYYANKKVYADSDASDSSYSSKPSNSNGHYAKEEVAF